jgi:hypothetical protein
MSDLGYTNPASGTAWSGYATLSANHDTTDGTGGSASKVYLYAKNAHVSQAAVIDVAIYECRDNTWPGVKLSATAQITVPANSAAGWFSADMSATLAANTKYWIAKIVTTAPAGFEILYFSRDTDRHFYYTNTSFPDPWAEGVGTSNSNQWLMYVEYAATAQFARPSSDVAGGTFRSILVTAPFGPRVIA